MGGEGLPRTFCKRCLGVLQKQFTLPQTEHPLAFCRSVARSARYRRPLRAQSRAETKKKIASRREKIWTQKHRHRQRSRAFGGSPVSGRLPLAVQSVRRRTLFLHARVASAVRCRRLLASWRHCAQTHSACSETSTRQAFLMWAGKRLQTIFSEKNPAHEVPLLRSNMLRYCTCASFRFSSCGVSVLRCPNKTPCVKEKPCLSAAC